MTGRSVIRRIRALDHAAKVVHQVGSHQKWRLSYGSSVIVPIHRGDVPIGTLRSIQRQGEKGLGAKWFLGPK
jgi:predicted RNA binding protein YcfA (HicA-like mRNA interferase family)